MYPFYARSSESFKNSIFIETFLGIISMTSVLSFVIDYSSFKTSIPSEEELKSTV